MKQRREALGLSLRALSKKVGISRTHLANLEDGSASWEDMQLSNIVHIAEGLDLDPDELIRAARGQLLTPEEQVQQQKAVEQMAFLEAQPEWVALDVVGIVHANFDPDNVKVVAKGSVAYFPKDKLRGANLKNCKAYYVNGDCMISNDARLVQKSIAPGDYIAVELGRAVEVGDIVVGWWAKERKMVIKRYGIDRGRVVLYSMNPAHPNLVMEEDEFIPIGKFLARAG